MISVLLFDDKVRRRLIADIHRLVHNFAIVAERAARPHRAIDHRAIGRTDPHHAIARQHITKMRRMIVKLMADARRKAAAQDPNMRIFIQKLTSPLTFPPRAQRHR